MRRRVRRAVRVNWRCASERGAKSIECSTDADDDDEIIVGREMLSKEFNEVAKRKPNGLIGRI
jgi:hypothetical protein